MKPEKYVNTDTGEVKVGRIIVYVACVTLVLLLAVFVWHNATRPARTVSDVLDKTFDADNVIHNYEWFKQIVEDIEAMEKKIAITAGAIEDFKSLHTKPYDDWSFEDKGEMSRLSTDLRGQKAHFEQLKADLKAKSKMANRTIFKGDNQVISWVDKVSGASDN